ncbi:MAG: AraC-like DNA-binding protein [Oleispira sp.]|jgi:AraC-like DNA-binding protein
MDLDEHIYPTYKIATLNQVLIELGMPEYLLLEGTSLTPEGILSNTTRISRRQVIQIYRRLVAITTDPSIGLIAGQRLGMTNYGIYGYAMISSASLREALLFSIKYHEMATPTVRMSLHDDHDDYASFRFDDLLRVDSIYSFNVEMQFSLVFSLFKDMAGYDFRYFSVCAKFPKPDHASMYEQILKCPAFFRQDHNEMRFDKAWLDTPLVRANPITAATTRELCDQVLLEMRTHDGLAHQVYEVITEDIRRFSKIEPVAEQLHMSARSLRRKLTGQGTSYQQILIDVRRQLAIEFLRHTKFSSEEIADRLGFTDAANFRHAFKRWTGKTTSDYRS